MTIETEVKLEGLDEFVATLKALPPEFASKNGGIMRQVLFQTAKVPEEAAKKRAPKKTGRLANSIKKRRMRNPERKGYNEGYEVTVNPGRSRDDPKGAFYFFWVHDGSERNKKPNPFATDAWDQNENKILDEFLKQTDKRMKLVLRRAAKAGFQFDYES